MMRAWLRGQKHALKPDVPWVHHRRQYSMGQCVHPSLSMASKPTAGQGVSVCVCVNVAYVARSTCMHARQTKEQQCTHFYQYWKRAHVTIDLNGKTTACDGMQPARLKRTTSHLAPHLGGVAASIGTLNRAGAYTLARACASALQNKSLNQYVDPASL